MKKSQENKFKIMMVAAEASSSLYAQRLLELWNKEGVAFEAFGIGSREMEKEGFECLGRSEELAVMGIAEVLGSLKKIVKVFYKLVEEAKKRKPDVILLLDYPEFNFKIAKKLKKLGFRIVYYISPQIWAWRSGRVKFIQKNIDKMLVLFPFEVDFYKKFGVDVQFVGHPLLNEIDEKLLSREYKDKERAKFGILPNEKVLALMPGSRQSELQLHLQEQIETAQKVLLKSPSTKVMLFIAPNLEIENVKSYISNLKFPLIFVKRNPFEMIAMADFILCCSGTATLVVGLMEVPMIIMYKFKSATIFFAKLIMKIPKNFGMVNLILNKTVCPEFLQEEANSDKMSAEILKYLNNSDLYSQQVEELKKLKESLGSKGATQRVSDILLSMRGS